MKFEKYSSLFGVVIPDRIIQRLIYIGIPLHKKEKGHCIDRIGWDQLRSSTKESADRLILSEIKAWLSDRLSKGAMKRSDVRKAAEAEGINKRMLTRAQRSLDVQGYTEDGERYWRLPDKEGRVTVGENFVAVPCAHDEVPW